MKTFLQTLFFFLLVTQICFAQVLDETKNPKQTNEVLPIRLPHPSHTHVSGKSTVSLHPSFYDRKAEWQWVIDSTWGPGESLSGKRATFDLYQNFARSYNSTFLWNSIDWDSLAVSLYSKINDSTSRGAFARIMNDLAAGMKDGHAHAYDDTVFFETSLDPGTPILVDGSGYINHFGAGLTPLADSSLLVYKVVPNHPLGLEPGDIILGYEGVPWHQIVHELLDGNVPQSIWRAPAPSAYNRYLLESAGESWHLFDTIDVIKHSTGLTVHLPLDPMVNLIAPDYIINNEQMLIPGVPMPEGMFFDHGAVTYGIIEGTNIGYIYVYNHEYPGVSSEFDAAVLALMQTDGLIIDIRVDWGGYVGLNTGISRLMNFQTYTLDDEKRCSPVNLYDLCPSPTLDGLIPNDIGTYYDRPIAVLIGSGCLSWGDLISWQLTYVPYARMFGRSPCAAFSGMVLYTQPSRPGYSLRCPDITTVDHYFPYEPRWGQEFPNFEEVWLTPDGVVNGEDDVVNRALEWMNNLVYPHNVLTNQTYYTPGYDTVHLSTTIENPNAHQLSALAYLRTEGGHLIDSVYLRRSRDLNAASEYWGGEFILPSGEEFYKISITSFDQTTTDNFAVPNATRLTTIGPVVLDSIYYVKTPTSCLVKPFIRNRSTNTTISNALVSLKCDDPWVESITPSVRYLPNIPPGGVVSNPAFFSVQQIDSLFPGYFNFKFEIIKDGWTYWKNSMQVIITGVEDEDNEIPTEFVLKQNYPNPFNPNTTIRYSIAEPGNVKLTLYNLLGEVVAGLVNEEKPTGNYSIEFNAANLPSGVYFYQLKAGNYLNTKKMILMK